MPRRSKYSARSLQGGRKKKGRQSKRSRKSKSQNPAKLIEAVFAPKIPTKVLPPSVARSRRTTMSPVKLSGCALKYGLACTLPFDSRSYGACNPAGKQAFTQKAHCIQRFTAYCGSSGFGFVAVSPSIANDAFNVAHSNTALAGTSALILTANNTFNAGVSIASPSTLPYSTTNLATASQYDNPPVIGRVVSCGVRITYTGTTMAESGTYYGLTEPNHGNVSGASQVDIGVYNVTKVVPVSRTPFELTCYSICDDEDDMAGLHFNTNASRNVYPLSSGDAIFNTTYRGATDYTVTTGATSVNAGSPIMIVAFTGANSAPFQVEVITHVEYSGQLPQAVMSKAHMDPVGASTVRGALVQNDMSNPTDYRSTYNRWKDFVGFLAEASHDILKMTVPRSLSMLTLEN